MSLVGLMIILSANAALCAFIAPDSILGGFTKCTVTYITTEPSGPDYTKKIISEALYNSTWKLEKEAAQFANGKFTQATTYNYNSKGDLLEWCEIDESGKIIYKSETTILNNVYTTRMIDYSHGIDTNSIYIISYDNNKNPIKWEYISNIPEFHRKSFNNFDERNNISSDISIDDDDTTKSKYDNKYDPNGRLSEITSYNTEGKIRSITTYKYESDGSKTINVREIEGGNYLWNTTKYDANGKEIEETTFNPDGVCISKNIHNYSNNRLIEYIEYTTGDELKTKITFYYDEYGNPVRNTYYLPNNEVEKTIEYVYSK